MPENSGALIPTPNTSIPLERFLFGNEHWRSYRAIDEIEVHCDLLDNLEIRIVSLETSGKDEEAALTNVQAVISSYALEIAIKSFWALDYPDKCVPQIHKLTTIFDQLKEETKKSLEQCQLTRKVLAKWPRPFLTNRYSMEISSRNIPVYKARFLRSLIQVLGDKLEESREALHKPPQASAS